MALFRCPVCRTRRRSWPVFQRHVQATEHRAPCDCGGYHHKHRPGSRFCHLNPLAPLRHADRQRVDDDSLRDIASRIVTERPELQERVVALLEQWGIHTEVAEAATT